MNIEPEIKKPYAPRLPPEILEGILSALESGDLQKSIARRYGITPALVAKISSRLLRKKITRVI